MWTFDAWVSVAQRLNSSGSVLSSSKFDAYGLELSSPASSEPWGFGAQAGYYTDRETGLQLLGLRYYDPAQGRFLNRDPSGYAGGINLYGYTHNSPTSLTDPTGLGGDDMWYDRWGEAAQAAVGTAKAYYNDGLTDPSLGTAAILGATLENSAIDFVGGLLQLPRLLGHLGEGTECFWDHPSWETFPALMQDVATAGAAVGSVGAAGIGAEAEGAAASATDAGSAEVATEGGECGTGTGCFVAGTPVRMADGSTQPVEQIRPGDRVQSRDPATGVVTAKRVVRTYIHTVDHTLVLTLPDGEEIETTEVHPFYVAGRGFVEAGKLGVGTAIVTRAGPSLTIAGIERRPGRVRVYNFEVEGFHTYCVGQSGGGVWVHNATLCDPEPEGPFRQIAEKIGKGHAFDKHVIEREEFDMIDEEFVDHIERVIEKCENGAGHMKPLEGRPGKAYYDPESNTIVVHDPPRSDAGTAFRGTLQDYRAIR